MWVLLYQENMDDVRILSGESASIGAGVCAWGFGAIRRAFPALALSASAASRVYLGNSSEERNFKRYWWVHASLLLWNQTFGYGFPLLEYYWRIEPDVVYTKSWADLVDYAAADKSDLVLPKYVSQEDSPSYVHWRAHELLLSTLPQRERVFSLVSLGRYSRLFLRLMAESWAAGVSGYEEITLPARCLPRNRCKRTSFTALAHRRLANSTSHLSTSFFRYNPCWKCDAFLRAAAAYNSRQQLWHPVKSRECWADYLDATSSGTQEVALGPAKATHSHMAEARKEWSESCRDA